MKQTGRDDYEIGWRGQASGRGGDAGWVGKVEAGGARPAGNARKAGVGVELVGKGGTDAASGADDDGMGIGCETGKQGSGLFQCMVFRSETGLISLFPSCIAMGADVPGQNR